MSRYTKVPNDPQKTYCNALVCQAFKIYIYDMDTHKSVFGAFVLDDEHFQSTYSLTSNFKYLTLQLAQYDGWTFEKMKHQMVSQTSSNIVELHYGDYGDLKPKFGKIHLDHADFCSGWFKNKHTIQHRFDQAFYASTSILRLTVSYRGCKMSGEEHVKVVLTDLYDMVVNTDYSVKPLTISQLDPEYLNHHFNESDADSVCFSYGTMQTFIILITNTYSTKLTNNRYITVF